ncbi:serum amyloid P-component-like [Lepisosteus oculatus]|uniref:Pentraxin family member n=1 Tax=Lepisosteus oculatus TaxID=7918 RepID=W5N660_LEPOC|nr:PREDICTED: serum amyloid P-component-like [Lepisosteus oculatus]
MEKLLFLLALLACGSGEPQDLTGKMFTFPGESNVNYVKLIPKKWESFSEVTVCLDYATDLQRGYSLFSVNTPGQDNALLLYKLRPGQYRMHVNAKQDDLYDVPEETEFPHWTHVCVTWESSSGLFQLWVNGKGSIRKGINRSGLIQKEPFIVLGQEQDSYGGTFDKQQSFVGQISNVHMWNQVLSPCEIQNVHLGKVFDPGNILSWKSMSFESKGYVILEEIIGNDKCRTSSLDPTRW